ncbi:phosphodiester glycosidase family protein [Plectonema cf. radiosum LEGE 06105]|uniref:Phosphodiester glycosidase family protein n=1 Tax=Plectonema cf. radiosum LEGE 06105 TaxID=945769 RepID=A0A8J7JS58_9CYAN|nr:phosphodiester glycosidase family protein [Plectonema radiosum]MBE9212129.1 phosphodiester glycosidase family protein [Plectonema cf. radiosum LEGE 06105]
MRLIPKNPVLGYRFLTLICPDKSHKVVTKLMLVMICVFGFLELFPTTQTIAQAANNRNACIQNNGLNQQISNLLKTTINVSNLVSNSDQGVKVAMQTFASPLSSYLNSSDFDRGALDVFSTIPSPLQAVVPVGRAIAISLEPGFNFSSPIQRVSTKIDDVPLVLISGGKPVTIHADSRYQLEEVVARSGINPVAAVDGTFFSLKFLDSNVMIGPVYSYSTKKFIPGNKSENKKLAGRPLVLISPYAVSYIPFEPDKHNTLEGIQAEMSGVTDAFVGAAWLVKNGEAKPANYFNFLQGADATRFRAFWGMNKSGVPVIGISAKRLDSASLGKALVKAGFQDAVMLDSGASTSLVYKGQSLVGYVPRPVPHAVALIGNESDCN